MTPPVLRTEALSHAFTAQGRRVTALDAVNLELGEGLSALVGPDGAGKTTLLRLAAGLLRPAAGELRVLGLDPLTQGASLHRRIGYLPQRFGLYQELSVAENLRLYADLGGLAPARRAGRIDELLELTGLAPFPQRRAGQLSGGMQQKLALAATLIREPELLLLDEPTVGVDPVSRRELWRILEELTASRGVSVVLSTAYMDEAERCARVAVLHQGRLLANDQPEALMRPVDGRSVAVSVPDLSLRALQQRLAEHEGVQDAVIAGEAVRAVLAEADTADRLAAELALEGLQVRAQPPRFEDAFVDLLAGAGAGGSPPELTGGPAGGGGDDDVVVAVADLRKRFGDFEAVKGLDFEIRRGEIFGLLGANGAGKTTTFRMLCGLLPASSGRLQVAGVDLRRAAAAARGRIGYVSQHFALYRNLSVGQNLRFFAGAYNLGGRRRRQRMAWAARSFELEPVLDQDAGTLPLGYQQRLALGCALMHEPEIVFLDEPTSGVDPLARREFWASINSLAESGVTVLVTTHFLEEADYCDRLVIMADGATLAAGTPGEVKRRAAGEGEALPSMEEAFIALVAADREAA